MLPPDQLAARDAMVSADRVAVFDGLARRAIERLAPLQFAVAATPADRDAVLRMRYDCVVAEGWIRPDDLPEGRESDDYDDDATFIVCRDGDALVASLRIVPPQTGRPLPTERDFRVQARPPGSVFEVGRVVVVRGSRRARSHLVIGGLAARSWLAAHAHGLRRALSTATPELIELYEGLGLHVTVVGPAKLHWGAMRAPILIDGDERNFSFLTA